MGSSFLKGKKQKGQLYIYNLTSAECRVIFQTLLWARNTLGWGEAPPSGGTGRVQVSLQGK